MDADVYMQVPGGVYGVQKISTIFSLLNAIYELRGARWRQAQRFTYSRDDWDPSTFQEIRDSV